MSLHHDAQTFTRLFNTPHYNACNEESALAEQPKSIHVRLRSHQLAVIHRMSVLEQELRLGLDISGEKLYSRFGILGDSVGSGKSLMVLGHIANFKAAPKIENYPKLNPYSSQNIFSLIQKEHHDLSNCPALLIVPHVLYRQWQDYIDKQSTLNAYYIKTRKTLQAKDFLKKILTSDIVMVSNTLLNSFLGIVQNKIWFSRTYIDEADTIHISSTTLFPQTSFVWFITASWPNIMFENTRIWLSNTSVSSITASQNFEKYDPLFRREMLEALVTGRGYFNRFTSRSPLYFRDHFRVEHPYRTNLVIKCSDSFISQSITLPPLFSQIIECEPPVSQRIVGSAVSSTVQNLLNAGDIQGALTQLGCASDSPLNIVQAVTENRMKELERLEKTYEFKSSMEYATPQAKEAALKNLEQKIESLKEQIQTIRDRIENYNKETCPVCYDDPQESVITPCCSRVFCAVCILMSLARIKGCPMCRTEIQPNLLVNVSQNAPILNKKKEEVKKGPPKKIDALMDLIIQHPKDKFLVFSRYENPFRTMADKMVTNNIKVETVKGNMDVIHSLMTKFEKGDVRVLLLNSNHAGSGLNITSATYVVLWHAMTAEEEKQILGRAYRMGRDKPLHFVKLLHPNEQRPS